MQLPALQIGNVRIDRPVALSPMAGLTDTAWRTICMDQDCGFTYTEMVNVEGVIRNGARTMHLLESVDGERPLVAHLYGHDPDRIAAAAAVVESLERFDVIDINCGCPVRKILARGAGAGLIKDPSQIERIVAATKAAVTMPVTVKTRIGFAMNDMKVLDLVSAVEQGGGDAIAIHARFAAVTHAGDADWEALARAKAASSIPVMGNGGADTAADALRMFEATGVDAVLVGRAAMGNPWIFREIDCLVRGEEFQPPSLDERKRVVLEHLARLVTLERIGYETRKRKPRHGPEVSAVFRFRPHLFRYFSGFRGFARVRRGLEDLRQIEDVERAVDRLILENGPVPSSEGTDAM